MKNLFVLRHAKTTQHYLPGEDFGRSLLIKGQEQVVDLASFFSKKTFQQDFEICVSTAKRTRQTFDGIKTALQKSQHLQNITFYKELYLATREDLLQFLWTQTSSNDLFILGHNEGLSEIVSYFTEEHIILSTGEFIQLQFDCDEWNEISRGLASIVDRFQPLK